MVLIYSYYTSMLLFLLVLKVIAKMLMTLKLVFNKNVGHAARCHLEI